MSEELERTPITVIATRTTTTVTRTAMDQHIVTGTDKATGMPTAYLVTNTDTTTATLTTATLTRLTETDTITSTETDPAFTVMTDSLSLCFPPLSRYRR